MSKTVVIVGAGSAGCVIANRLSGRPDRRVILLEAGPDYAPEQLPEDLRRGGRNSFTAHDWGYKHRPSEEQWKFPFPRGRVVGGSSAVNTCIAIRGQPEDYDEWADRGLPDWTWDNCLPAFRRLESDLDYGDTDDPEFDKWHGNEGPLPIRRHPPAEWTPWQEAFVAACRHLGYEDCADTNRPGTKGVGPHALNKTADGRRISAAEAWLTPPVRGRPNLTLRSETLVRRVIFEGRRAVGVEVEPYDRPGATEVILADEVVLTAGAINTPGILYRSGVGPKSQLDTLGVDTVAQNENIGTRLLDHPGVAIFLLPRFGAGTSRKHDLIQTVCRFGSAATDLPNDIIMQPGSAVPLPRISLPAVSVMFSLGKPAGHGRLRYETTDPRETPTIDSLLLDHPVDHKVACDALERALEITQTPQTQQLARVVWPPVWELRDRDTLEERIYSVCDSGYHPCGTVPMGPEDDPQAACDGRGRVYGTERLRVADASIMPTIPSANIHLSVLMIGERFGAWL